MIRSIVRLPPGLGIADYPYRPGVVIASLAGPKPFDVPNDPVAHEPTIDLGPDQLDVRRGPTVDGVCGDRGVVSPETSTNGRSENSSDRGQ